jgi:hypothetical protein
MLPISTSKVTAAATTTATVTAAATTTAIIFINSEEGPRTKPVS